MPAPIIVAIITRFILCIMPLVGNIDAGIDDKTRFVECFYFCSFFLSFLLSNDHDFVFNLVGWLVGRLVGWTKQTDGWTVTHPITKYHPLFCHQLAYCCIKYRQ